MVEQKCAASPAHEKRGRNTRHGMETRRTKQKPRLLSQMGFSILAGEEGLEPSHAGIKIRCLDQLGDSPTMDAIL